MSDVFERWQLNRVINASGTMTAIGASRVAPSVVADVSAILGEFVDIDELQARACEEIVRATGAEAGYVTSSSSAAVMLAVAAAIAGEDLAAIEALPNVGGRENRIALQMGHMINYGAPIPQAIALAGGAVIPLGTAAHCETYHLESALKQGVAAAVYVVSHHTVHEGELPLELFISICRDHGTPVIIDMASEYDLCSPMKLGADAAIYSGHKFLSGTTSGIVAGSRAMIRAMYLQNRGIGRVTKVGKEGIMGAMAALAAWSRRDHAAERAREEAIIDAWHAALIDVPGFSVSRLPDWTGNPITRVELRLASEEAGLHAWELAERLRKGAPSIAVRDDHVEHEVIHLDPCNLTAAEADAVAAAIVAACRSARVKSDGCMRSWNDEKRARGKAHLCWLQNN